MILFRNQLWECDLSISSEEKIKVLNKSRLKWNSFMNDSTRTHNE